jgi:hypothetical protein
VDVGRGGANVGWIARGAGDHRCRGTGDASARLLRQPDGRSILHDEPRNYPGVIRAAFIVDDLDDLVAMLRREGTRIAGGPVVYGGRRKVILNRDPDGNVLQFDELPDGSHAPTALCR